MASTRSNLRRTLLLTYGGGAICLFLIVAFSLNWSSLGWWNRYLPSSYSKESHVILGKPRGIRSDEWLVSTPTMLAYVEHRRSGLATTPDYAGPVGAELLMNQPASHFSTIFRPQLWGFFLFDKDRGFSFFWGVKTVGLFLAFFTVLLLLTESPIISAAGTTWFILSSFVQWWFSTSLPEMVATCVFATMGAWLVISHSAWRIATLGWIALVVRSINFILILYPPFMVVTAHACLAIFCALYCKYGVVRGRALVVRTAALVVAGLVIIASILLTWFDVHSVVEIVRNTVNPGRRVSVSGDFPSFRYIANFVDAFFSEERLPSGLGNVCEGSGFILLWPLAVLALAHGYFRKQIGKQDLHPFIPLLTVLVLHTAWMSFSIPARAGSMFGLHLVPASRALLGPGILNVVVVSMVSVIALKAAKPMKHATLTALSIIFMGILVGWSIQKALPSFLSFQELSLVSIAIASASIGLLIGHPLLLWLPILCLVLPNALVNPLAKGTAPLTKHPLLEVASKVREKDSNARWAVYDEDGAHANLLKVSGVRVFNGVSYAPRMDDYKIIDPEGKYSPVYNRYAHIALKSTQPGELATFKTRRVDAIIAEIHPCDSAFTQIGVRYFVFVYKPQSHEVACLQEFPSGPVGKRFYLYQRTN